LKIEALKMKYIIEVKIDKKNNTKELLNFLVLNKEEESNLENTLSLIEDELHRNDFNYATEMFKSREFFGIIGGMLVRAKNDKDILLCEYDSNELYIKEDFIKFIEETEISKLEEDCVEFHEHI